MKNLEVFNEIRSNLSQLAEKNKGIKINGVEDVENYSKAKDAQKELRGAEIDLEKLAKSERQQALEYQRGIIALEKDLLAITNPIIEDLKEQIKEIDEIKAREIRKVLLPDRQKKLKEINYNLSDKEILNYDEKEWAEFYDKIKLEYLDKKEQERLEEQRKKDEAERIKKAQEEAKEQAIRQERERQEKEKDIEAQRILQEEANKKAQEEARLKDERLLNWLKENNINVEDRSSYKIVTEKDRLLLYRRISELLN